MTDKNNVSKKYKLLEIIGKGKFGTVHKGLDLDSKHFIAIKVLNLDTDREEVKDIQQEIQFLSQLKSAPNITHYYGSYLNGHKLWIIMDYCAGGSVRTLLRPGPLQEKYISIIARELLIALQFIHNNGVIHRDIKAANILISKEGKIKLCDFGVAAQLTSTALKRTTMAGTPYWMAPEVITEGATYNSKADIWSTGITIYEMATGNPPYSDKDVLRAMQFITQHEPSRLEGRQYGPLLKEIIAMCLEEKPNLRPSAEDLLAKSKFIKSNKTLPTSLIKEVIGKYLLWRDSMSKKENTEQEYINNNNNNNNNNNQNNENNNDSSKHKKHVSNASTITADTSFNEDGENFDLKWDFDSLKSAEYIIENDINLENENNDKFDEFYFDNSGQTNTHYRDFTTSPYNKTFTIGNTMVNNVMNHNFTNTATASATQIDSIINSNMNSMAQTPTKKEAPKSLLQLFHDDTIPESDPIINTNIIHEEKEKINLSITIPPTQQIPSALPTPIQSKQVHVPVIPIEIPNMDDIESEIQEREKQRSRAATVNASNTINNNINSNININNVSNNNNQKFEVTDQPLPIRRPTISLLNDRTPSPAKMLEHINTQQQQQQQQSSPSKQSSALYMKPLPINTAQPLLQPLNGGHKPKNQIATRNLSSEMSGPQTAPAISNSEMYETSFRTKSSLRIQMPAAVSANVSSFTNIFKDNNGNKQLNIFTDNAEKNQFGFDVNAAASLPLAMTPVTEKPHGSFVTPEKEMKNLDKNEDLQSHPSTSTISGSMKSFPFTHNNSMSNITSVANNSMPTMLEKSNTTDFTNKHWFQSQSQNGYERTSNRKDFIIPDDSEFADSTLTNANLNGENIINNENIVTGLGMMTMNDSGNISPIRANSNISNQNVASSDKLFKVIDKAQINMNKLVGTSLCGLEMGKDELLVYSNEIDDLLNCFTNVIDIAISELQ